MINLPIEDLLSKLPKPLPKRVVLQLPEGVQPQATRLVAALEAFSGGKTTVFVTGDPCYGACDLADDEARKVDAELVIQVGHTPFGVEKDIAVFYYPFQFPLDIPRVANTISSYLPKGIRIGLAATAQHVNQLEVLKDALAEKGVTAYIGPNSERVAAGQILGCDCTTCTLLDPPVDAFLFLGSGVFHPLGIAYSSGKPVYAYDPYEHKINRFDDEYRRLRGVRLSMINEAVKAKTYGVIVSTKLGQAHPGDALRIRDNIRARGMNAIIILFHTIRADSLLNFPDIDAFIMTACPRVALDDQSQFTKPVLTPSELDVVFGKRGFNDVYPPQETS